MADTVQIDEEKFRNIYEYGFRTWAALAIEGSAEDAGYDYSTDIFLHQPPFPPTLSLKREFGRAFATGSSIWSANRSVCGLTSFQIPMQIGVSRKERIKLTTAAAQQDESHLLFSHCDENYLAILVLVWAYTLSARWAEVMSEPCSISYTDNCVPCEPDEANHCCKGNDAFRIDLTGARKEEIRWWVSILAPEHGWQASIIAGQELLYSPWSTRFRSDQRFYIVADARPSAQQHTAPSFSEANQYIMDFCERHNLFDQSRAALAVALLLPAFGNTDELQLPTPRRNTKKQMVSQSASIKDQEKYELLHESEYLDKCLVMSCNVKGIRPILLSAFYDPDISCNAVTPWLQGSLAAINSTTKGSPYRLWRMMASRAPSAAWLWLGAVVLGLQQKLLREVGFGQIPIDITSAAWSGTVQSFMQAPVTRNSLKRGFLERADECKLLFLSQASYHTRLPVCQWKPFGSTALADTYIEVRNHVECQEHEVRYDGVSWDCIETNEIWSAQGEKRPSPIRKSAKSNEIPISYDAMNQGDEFVSENATRSIFGWLRFDGYSPHERAIWDHDWFAMDSDDDDEPDEQESGSSEKVKKHPEIQSWLSTLPTTHDETLSYE